MTTSTASVATRVLRSSGGPQLTAGDLVWVWYEGNLLNGKRFDANYSFGSFSAIPERTEFRFQLGIGQVIRGWDQALVNRRLGEVLELTIPAELAYGSQGIGDSESGSGIPPNSVLRFKVEILARFGRGDSRISEVSFADLGVDIRGFQRELSQIQAYKVGLDSGDVIIGGPLADLLLGLRGNDRLRGDNGSDILVGGSGSDQLEGGKGDDVLDGGVGLDTAVFGAANNTVRLAVAGPQATGEGNDTLIAIENVKGGAGNDRISGNASVNRLDGGPGRDLLNGGGGQDYLTGGGDADTFVYTRLSDSLAGANKRDIITDFNGDAGDRINLAALDASAKVAGRQPFLFIGAQPFSDNNAGVVRFSNGLLQINTDHDRLANMEIALPGVTSFSERYLLL